MRPFELDIAALEKWDGAAFDPSVQGLPFDELHGDERLTVRLADVVDRADVRVIQLRGEAHFQRDVALEPRVARSPDFTHPACASSEVIS